MTDVLVLRGNDAVIQSTVNNPGAEFTERGFSRLVNRAEGDDDLATCVGLRPTIPRHLYLKLLAKASAAGRLPPTFVPNPPATSVGGAGEPTPRGEWSNGPGSAHRHARLTPREPVS